VSRRACAARCAPTTGPGPARRCTHGRMWVWGTPWFWVGEMVTVTGWAQLSWWGTPVLWWRTRRELAGAPRQVGLTAAGEGRAEA